MTRRDWFALLALTAAWMLFIYAMVAEIKA